MQPNDRLDYAVFQLTPTRTRCELHVTARGLTYKLASGLLKPFVLHLQAAEEQLARGGYSIRLEPPDPAPWFTKGTMERFVRFVSTPEVLERVSTIQVEISEIENTISAQSTQEDEANEDQSNKSAGVRSTACVSLEKSSKSADCADIGVEESSKQRLLRALNARCTMLQKEQGMAFARAIAAGFSIEQMDDLVAFAECFGATRLREACKKFVALCKKRQEAGLWLEDLDLAVSGNYHHEMAHISGAHEMVIGYMKSPRDCMESWVEQRKEVDDEQQAGFPAEGKLLMVDDGSEKLTRRCSLDSGTEEYLKRTANGYAGAEDKIDRRDLDTARGIGLVRGHSMMSSWPGQQIPSQFLAHGGMHPTMSMAYPFPGATRTGAMPYPPYLGGTYMHSPYGDAMAWQGARGPTHPLVPSQYWQGSQGYGNNPGPFASEAPSGQHPPNMSSIKQSVGFSSEPSHATNEQDNGEYTDSASVDAEAPFEATRRLPRRSASPTRRSASPMRKVQIGCSGKRQSSGMVIRNINYIAPNSQGQTKADGEGGSSGSWSEEEGTESQDDKDEVKSDTGRLNLHDVIGLFESKKAGSSKRLSKKEARKLSRNGGLEDDNDISSGEVTSIQRELFPHEASSLMERNKLVSEQIRANDLAIDAETGVRPKRGAVGAQMSDDMVMVSENQRCMQHDSEFIAQQEKRDGKKLPLVDESFMDSYRMNIKYMTRLVDSRFEFSGKSVEDLKLQKLDNIPSDDSFMVVDRSAKDMSWRVPFTPESENLRTNDREHTQVSERFEPVDLLMVPEGNRMSASKALHDDMQMFAAEMMEGPQNDQDNVDHGETELIGRALEQEENLGEETRATSTKKVPEKGAKAKAMQEMLERRNRGVGRKTNPVIEAQQRAEKLRMFKAGLRKSKQDQEEEERKRIEDLRRQRQERIAARSSRGGVIQSPSSKASVVNKSSSPALIKSSSLNLAHSERHQIVKGHLSPGSLSNRPKASLNGNKASGPPLSSPKVVASAVSCSVPSLAELQKESSKSSLSLPAVHSSTESTLPSLPMGSAVSCSLPSLGDLRKQSSKSLSLLPAVHSNATMEQKKHRRISEEELASPLPTKLKVHSEGKKHPMLSAAAQKVLSPAKEPKGDMLPSTKVVKVHSPASKLQGKLASVREPPSMPSNDVSGRVSLKDSPMQELPKRNEIISKPGCSFPASEVSVVPESNGDTPCRMPSFVDLSTGPTGSTMIQAVVEETSYIPDHDDAVKGMENSKQGFVSCSFVQQDSQSGSDDGHVEPEVGPTICEDLATLMDFVVLVDDGSTASMDDANGTFVPLELPSTSSLPSVAEQNELPAPDSPHLNTPENLPCLLDAIQQTLSPDASPLHLGSAKARKRWGERTPKDHAKGLRRLLLLGRKSSKNSTQNYTQNSTDSPTDRPLESMLCEGDEHANKERGLTPSMGSNMAYYVDSAEFFAKVHGEDGSGGLSKGSRSFFLSNFRGRTEAKAKS